MQFRDLTRGLVTGLALALGVCAAPAVTLAHHSHQRFYDWCTTVTIEGRITRVEWKNPHSLIDVETNDGTTYHVEWTSAQILARQYNGAPPDALAFGARVVVIAHPARDADAVRASFPDWKGTSTPNTVDPAQIRRADNTFNWAPQSASPENCSGK
jgi:hypothetical protein